MGLKDRYLTNNDFFNFESGIHGEVPDKIYLKQIYIQLQSQLECHLSHVIYTLG